MPDYAAQLRSAPGFVVSTAYWVKTIRFPAIRLIT